MNELKEQIINRFNKLEADLNGLAGSKFHDLRTRAFNSIQKSDLPGPKSEEYKYTHLTRNINKHFDLSKPTVASNISGKEIETYTFPHEEANIFFFVNGILRKDLSKIHSSSDELTVLNLKEAYSTNSVEIDTHFGKYADISSDPFTSLNTAFAEHGAFIKIASNTVLSRPIILHFITDSTDQSPVYFPRNLILAGKNSEAHIIESFQGVGDQKGFINHVTELVAEESSRINYYKLQEDATDIYRIDNSQIIQKKNSVFSAFTFTFGGLMVRNNLNISLEDEHCETHMYGLYLPKGESHVDNHTAVDHKKANCFSNEIYKGILDENSTGVFNGKIFVQQQAQKTNAFQSNKNILLTDEATVYTKPQLEIWADDVKCSHGCTTGQLDEEQMFYLMARGISKKTARAMLLQAFANDVIEKVKVDFLREHLSSKILDRLHE